MPIYVSAIFTKGNNFYDFHYFSLTRKPVQKGSSFKENILLLGTNFSY